MKPRSDMSRSSGYSSRDDVRMEVLGQPRRFPGNTTLEYRPNLVRGATPFQFNRPMTQPRRSVLARRRSSAASDVGDAPVVTPAPAPMERASTIPLLTAQGQQSEENHAAQIVSEMEKDTALMEDNPVSEQLRMETLREMPESLTMKRSIKRKLVKSVSLKSRRSPLSLWKQLKYRISMSAMKMNAGVKNVLYTLELWYSSMKQIEGHFGSGVATYFRFLRWLFVLNSVVFLVSFGFVVIPQLLFRFYEPAETRASRLVEILDENSTTAQPVTPLPWTTLVPQPQVRSQPYASNKDFDVGNIFTGEGFFTDTTLYYGYYTNRSVNLVPSLYYDMGPAYFFSMLACYLFIFITLSVSMARSYRKTFIETTGDLKNVFAHKVFCGWDFSIATSEAAVLKSKSIYNEMTELLEDLNREDDEQTWRDCLTKFSLRAFLNLFVIVLLIGTGVLMWFLLKEELGGALVLPLIITIIIMLTPVIFSWLTKHELYVNPRTELFVTLVRTFAMEVVVIGVIVGYWLSVKLTSECWETSLGQAVYRLVIIDFLLAVVGTSLAEFVRYYVFKAGCKRIGAPEFNIARNTLNLIYNQSLFFVGFYFSPLLAFIIVLKFFITFYVKKYGLLSNCQPSARPWRAAQTQTLFLVLAFVASLGVLILLCYIVTQVRTSGCGPFQGNEYPYETILDAFQVRQEDKGVFLGIIKFLVKPGVAAGILLAMCVGVYYLRAKSQAQRRMVNILREMLMLEARDKEFLLRSISRVTEGQWMYNLKSEKHEQHGGGRNNRDNLDSTSSSAASGAGEHVTFITPSYSESLTDSDGYGHGDGEHMRSGYRPLGGRHQQPSTSAVFPGSSSDDIMIHSDYSGPSSHPLDYRMHGGLRERRY